MGVCVLSILLISGALASSEKPDVRNASYKYSEGDRYFLMSDAQGHMHLCDNEKPEDEDYIAKIKQRSDWASYLVYTRRNYNWPNEIQTGDVASLNGSFFDPTKQTKVIVHGWKGNGKNTQDTIKDAFLAHLDVNVIVVDWEDVASGTYISASFFTPHVAKSIANFLKFIYANKHDVGIHMVGHSLGGQTVGIAGRELGGQVARITALDPALPLWGILSRRIRSTDAVYVEVIHTNAYVSGQFAAIGDVDFYPNGGRHMEGCGTFDFSCSHSRSYAYFAESVRRDLFVGTKCKGVIEAMHEKCQLGSEKLLMGNTQLWKPETGVFYLKTNAQPPYGRGDRMDHEIFCI